MWYMGVYEVADSLIGRLGGAEFDPRNRGIVVADASGKRVPVIDVDMLDFGLGVDDGFRHQRVIELLRIHVEDVGVSFNWGNVGGLVNVRHQALEGCPHGDGLAIFVKVTRDDDRSLGILV